MTPYYQLPVSVHDSMTVMNCPENENHMDVGHLIQLWKKNQSIDVFKESYNPEGHAKLQLQMTCKLHTQTSYHQSFQSSTLIFHSLCWL